MNSKDLGRLLGVSTRRVDMLVVDGVLHRSAAGGFDREQSVRNYCNFLRRDDETRREKRQLLQAQRNATVLKMNRQAGLVLTPAEIHRRLEAHIRRLWDMRVLVSWLQGELDGLIGKEQSTVLGNRVETWLSGLIAEARDQLVARFPADGSSPSTEDDIDNSEDTDDG